MAAIPSVVQENSQKSMATRVLASMTVAYPKMPESMTEVSSAAHKVNISGEALKDTELTPTPAHEIRYKDGQPE